jgi:hypothetical protein
MSLNGIAAGVGLETHRKLSVNSVAEQYMENNWQCFRG